MKDAKNFVNLDDNFVEELLMKKLAFGPITSLDAQDFYNKLTDVLFYKKMVKAIGNFVPFDKETLNQIHLEANQISTELQDYFLKGLANNEPLFDFIGKIKEIISRLPRCKEEAAQEPINKWLPAEDNASSVKAKQTTEITRHFSESQLLGAMILYCVSIRNAIPGDRPALTPSDVTDLMCESGKLFPELTLPCFYQKFLDKLCKTVPYDNADRALLLSPESTAPYFLADYFIKGVIAGERDFDFIKAVTLYLHSKVEPTKEVISTKPKMMLAVMDECVHEDYPEPSYTDSSICSLEEGAIYVPYLPGTSLVMDWANAEASRTLEYNSLADLTNLVNIPVVVGVFSTSDNPTVTLGAILGMYEVNRLGENFCKDGESNIKSYFCYNTSPDSYVPDDMAINRVAKLFAMGVISKTMYDKIMFAVNSKSVEMWTNIYIDFVWEAESARNDRPMECLANNYSISLSNFKLAESIYNNIVILAKTGEEVKRSATTCLRAFSDDAAWRDIRDLNRLARKYYAASSNAGLFGAYEENAAKVSKTVRKCDSTFRAKRSNEMKLPSRLSQIVSDENLTTFLNNKGGSISNLELSSESITITLTFSK